MHALQFVEAFAAFTGQDYSTLRVIDRTLAEAGLRAKAKGKRMPDITLDEGVMFLLAVMANGQPTRAAEAAKEISSFVIVPTRESHKAVSLLARMVRRPVTEATEFNLLQAVTGLCRAIPQTFNWATLSVDRSGSAFLHFGMGPDSPGRGLQFAGSSDHRFASIGVMVDTRTANANLLGWIGEQTVLPASET